MTVELYYTPHKLCSTIKKINKNNFTAINRTFEKYNYKKYDH